MDQEQIKEWLEWFVQNFNYSFSTKGDLFESESWEIFAYKTPYGYQFDASFQLTLQHEIADQEWCFSLATFKNSKPHVLIRSNSSDAIAGAEADTILEAFMLAFKEAYEAVNQ